MKSHPSARRPDTAANDQAHPPTPAFEPAAGNAAMQQHIGRQNTSTSCPTGKAKRVAHGVVGVPEAHNVGYMRKWLETNQWVTLRGDDYGIELGSTDLHTSIDIQPRGTKYYSPIAAFVEDYGRGYHPKFNTYEGVIAHERQHVDEAESAYALTVGAFEREVAAIREEGAAEAEHAFDSSFRRFERALDDAFQSSGEALARGAEWDFYHREFEAFLAAPVEAEVLEWSVHEEQITHVVSVLERIALRDLDAAERLVDALRERGLLTELKAAIRGSKAELLQAIITSLEILD